MNELETIFALAFLMPENEYKEVVRKHTVDGIVDTKAVADYFHVTVSDAAFWGVELGLLKAW